MKEVYQKGNKVVIFEEDKPISEMKGGVIITCRVCRKEEAVTKGSVCDNLKLCVEHAQRKLSMGRRLR